ncbi:potassium-transporting ATPase subunit KdpC [Arthrobacter sp. Helios]|uniref:potassium-transporting ATPase subunit KdpC n=1 Tax=Arthrobacter sp. Helios TaxID=2828862 RepID=UPI002053ADC7|nr:potassium-transporting ATPase subunit KdpC [Arthrobacter sp. Helios]UPO77067.1 potassium-transporting ATPase subunit KdpC [Arthrobacter sp. Helios]
MTVFRSTARQLGTAARALLILTLTLGVAYPLIATGTAQVTAHSLANGSLVSAGGTEAGSVLIGQSFTDGAGAPLPQWFQSRPSAGNYDGAASGGTNLGPNSAGLAEAVAGRRAAVAELEGVAPEEVPADAVTASASGLDPHISPEYAYLQVDRVAAARSLDPAAVRALVEEFVNGRALGVLGEPAVNVLELNISLQELDT